MTLLTVFCQSIGPNVLRKLEVAPGMFVLWSRIIMSVHGAFRPGVVPCCRPRPAQRTARGGPRRSVRTLVRSSSVVP